MIAARDKWQTSFLDAAFPAQKSASDEITPDQANAIKHAAKTQSGHFLQALIQDLELALYEGWGLGKAILKVSADFDVKPTFAMEQLREHASQFGFLVKENESQTVVNLVDQALDDGWTPARLKTELQSSFADGYHVFDADGKLTRIIPTETWASTVARTELARAQTMGAMALYKAMDVAKVLWMTTEGANVCAICAPFDGQTYGINDLPDDIPVHPNCACALSPVVEGT